MSQNPHSKRLEFLPLEEIKNYFPDFTFSQEDFETLERAQLVISKIENGTLKVHLGSFLELLNLHIVKKAPDR